MNSWSLFTKRFCVTRICVELKNINGLSSSVEHRPSILIIERLINRDTLFASPNAESLLLSKSKTARRSVPFDLAGCQLLIADCFFRAMLLKSLLQPCSNRHGIARLNVMALHHVNQLPVAQQPD